MNSEKNSHWLSSYSSTQLKSQHLITMCFIILFYSKTNGYDSFKKEVIQVFNKYNKNIS